MIQGQPYGAQSDVWSLGVVLYELLNLERPFTGENISALAFRICEADIEDGDCAEHYSPGVCVLMRSMLKKDAHERLRLADFLRSDLVADRIPALIGLEALARRAEPAVPTLGRSRRRDPLSTPLVSAPGGSAVEDAVDEADEAETSDDSPPRSHARAGRESSSSSSSTIKSILRSSLKRFLVNSPVLDLGAALPSFRFRPKRRPTVERASRSPTWRTAPREEERSTSVTAPVDGADLAKCDSDAGGGANVASLALAPPVANSRIGYSFDEACTPGAEADARDQSMQKRHRRLIEVLLAHSMAPDATVDDLAEAMGDHVTEATRIEGAGTLGITGQSHTVRALHWLARSIAGGALEIEEPSLCPNGRSTIVVVHLKELRMPPGSTEQEVVLSTELGTKVTWDESRIAAIAIVTGARAGKRLRDGESAVHIAGGRRLRPRATEAKRSAVHLGMPPGRSIQRFMSDSSLPTTDSPAIFTPVRRAEHLAPLQLPSDQSHLPVTRAPTPGEEDMGRTPPRERTPSPTEPAIVPQPTVRRPAVFPKPVLSVRIISASKLNNIYVLPRPLNPYVTLRVGKKKHRTPTVYNTKSPRWVKDSLDTTEPFRFELERGAPKTAELEVTIKDRNPLSKNEWLASWRLPVATVSPSTGATGQFTRMELKLPARRFRGSDAVDMAYGTELVLELSLQDMESWWDEEEAAAQVDRSAEEGSTESPRSDDARPTYDLASPATPALLPQR